MTPGVIFALAAFAFGFLCTLCAGVWWISGLSTKVNYNSKEIDSAEQKMSKHEELCLQREEKRDKKLSAIYDKINEIAIKVGK